MNKLLIRHLPSFFTPEDTVKFLEHFDSINVVTFPTKGRMRNCAFATFADESSTLNALRNLHQFDLNGTRLVAEFAKESKQEESTKFDKDEFFSKLHSITSKHNTVSRQKSPFASKSPHPPISDCKSIHLQDSQLASEKSFVIQKITEALFDNPHFYAQVLDLMDYIKSPFVSDGQRLSEDLGEFNENGVRNVEKTLKDLPDQMAVDSIEDDLSQKSKRFDKAKKRKKIKRSVQAKNKKIKKCNDEQIKKRKIKASIEEASKKLKAKVIVPKSVESSDRVSEYFDNYVELRCNRIESKLRLSGKAELSESKIQIIDSFGKFSNRTKLSDATKPNQEQSRQLSDKTEPDETSPDSLFERQLNNDELKNNPVFENYSIGEPSCRLYLKNVDKKVTEEQLRRIYRDLLNLRSEADENAFNVNLFKKGKMNGQAFISLSSEQQAKLAIEKTNGLLINRKPICVSFARSIKVKD